MGGVEADGHVWTSGTNLYGVVIVSFLLAFSSMNIGECRDAALLFRARIAVNSAIECAFNVAVMMPGALAENQMRKVILFADAKTRATCRRQSALPA